MFRRISRKIPCFWQNWFLKCAQWRSAVILVLPWFSISLLMVTYFPFRQMFSISKDGILHMCLILCWVVTADPTKLWTCDIDQETESFVVFFQGCSYVACFAWCRSQLRSCCNFTLYHNQGWASKKSWGERIRLFDYFLDLIVLICFESAGITSLYTALKTSRIHATIWRRKIRSKWASVEVVHQNADVKDGPRETERWPS